MASEAEATEAEALPIERWRCFPQSFHEFPFPLAVVSIAVKAETIQQCLPLSHSVLRLPARRHLNRPSHSGQKLSSAAGSKVQTKLPGAGGSKPSQGQVQQFLNLPQQGGRVCRIWGRLALVLPRERSDMQGRSNCWDRRNQEGKGPALRTGASLAEDLDSEIVPRRVRFLLKDQEQGGVQTLGRLDREQGNVRLNCLHGQMPAKFETIFRADTTIFSRPNGGKIIPTWPRLIGRTWGNTNTLVIIGGGPPLGLRWAVGWREVPGTLPLIMIMVKAYITRTNRST